MTVVGVVLTGLCLLPSGIAAAQRPTTPTNHRTFVSGTGVDSGDCARPSPPCRTFRYALLHTTPGGEIIALDTGGFGSSLTIDREVTISAARGVHAGMTGVSGDLITVDAPAGADVVVEHLNLVGRGADNGIVVVSGELRLRDVSITRFAENGISAATPRSESISVFDSRITRNGDDGLIAHGSSPSDLRSLLVKNSTFERNGNSAISVVDNVRGTVTNSVIRKGAVGVHVQTTSGTSTTVNVNATTLTENAVALQTTLGFLSQYTKIKLGRSTISDNASAFVGSVFSFGDNTIEDNDTGNAPPAGTIARG